MEIIKKVKPILENLKSSFTPDYQPKETELMGLLVSNYFKWDSRIIDAFQEALEDANFHSFNAEIDKIREKENF